MEDNKPTALEEVSPTKTVISSQADSPSVNIGEDSPSNNADDSPVNIP
jgi:hypothetical protein